MQAFYKFGTRVLSYLLVVAGSMTLIVALCPVIAVEVGVLAGPYLDSGPPRLSLIRRRQMDTALALPPLPDQGRMRVGPSETPAVPPGLLASQLDLAERGDFDATYRIASYRIAALTPASQASSVASGTTQVHLAHRASKYAALTARDIFNQSFGVITASEGD